MKEQRVYDARIRDLPKNIQKVIETLTKQQNRAVYSLEKRIGIISFGFSESNEGSKYWRNISVGDMLKDIAEGKFNYLNIEFDKTLVEKIDNIINIINEKEKDSNCK